VILRFFNTKNIIIQFTIIVLFLFSMLNREIALDPPQDFGPLYNLIYQALVGSPLLISIAFISLIILQGILLQLIVMVYNLVPRNNYIVLLVWFFLIFANPSLASVNPVLISTLIMSWSLFQLLSLTNLSNPLPSLFTVGFIFSFSSLVYGNLIWFGIYLIVSLLLLSIFNARALVVSLIGFITPYLYLFTYGFVMDKNIPFLNQFHFGFRDWGFFHNGFELWVSIAITLLIFVLSIIAISIVMLHLNSKLIQTRNNTNVILAWLVTSIILQFLSGAWWFVHPTLILIPLSLFLSIYLSEIKKTRYIDILVVLIILLDIIQLYYPKYA